MTNPTLLLWPAACRDHDAGGTHADQAQRLDALHAALCAADLTPQAATALVDREALLHVHEASYVDGLFGLQNPRTPVRLDADTVVGPGSVAASRAACAATLQGLNACLKDKREHVFIASRPPGHHAYADRATGFCLLNMAALAVQHALDCGLERIAVIDFDVHHGDGTEALLANHAGVCLYSSFEHPQFPYTGNRSSAGNVRLLPLAAGTDFSVWQEGSQAWWSELCSWQPQLIVASAGFDALASDPIGGLRWQAEDYRRIGERIRNLGSPVLSVLEGGYDPPGMAAAVVEYLSAWQAR